ncbi:calcium/proton exchanger [Punctularia strigosozonata HHB-11173 SS5]|uniref:Calcium/proton exchanger n=1 Tax=Punctularia strigosozonata (strain HHB-11173) TaxID=741275 RepID=R7S070_PUNST|nr:calcium/proton exchanger [Punctularia strigosozonata HHB-11173 SS5]EIN03755.1 calcium/proton exchanger [Punctularia strigosozonata HHB-11173 SS5]
MSTQTNPTSPVTPAGSPTRSNSKDMSSPGPTTALSLRWHRLVNFVAPPSSSTKRAKLPQPSTQDSLKAIAKASWLNLLLAFIPVSWALHFAKPDESTIIFIFSFLAIIPLASLMGFATEDLSLRVGQTLAGLLNATLGNAVELIVAIIALLKCELRVVQASLVGSVLSNLLLVLGMCFFAGGMRYSEQGFSLAAAQINSSLLIISVVSVLIPGVLYFSIDALTSASPESEGKTILKISHGVAIMLLLVYCCYIVFQLRTHNQLFDDEHPSSMIESIRYQKDIKNESPRSSMHSDASPDSPLVASHVDAEAAKEHDEDDESPKMSTWVAIGLLTVITVLVAVTAEFLVGSINGLIDGTGISKEFVGLILLPIVGNAAEHVTAVTVSVKDKLTLSISVAVGSSIQIALFVLPFIVTLGWILGKPMTLLLDPFESAVLLLSVMTVNYTIQDGKSNWLEGVVLMTLFIIIGIVTWFYTGTDPSGMLATCT